MTHDELVERVAQAMCKYVYGHTGAYEVHRLEYTAQARVALAAVYEAMKKPTPEMVNAWPVMLAASPLNPEAGQ